MPYESVLFLYSFCYQNDKRMCVTTHTVAYMAHYL